MISSLLRCVQALVGLALIQNSFALRCHTCSQLMAACEIAECAPVQSILEKLGVTPGSGPVIDDADQTCISIEESDATGKDLMRSCIPSGKRWISLVGGQDGCKEVEKTKLVEVQKQDTDETLEWVKEKLNNTQQLTSPAPAPGFNLDKVLETIAELRQKAQDQILESSSGNRFKVCACQKELCNGDGIDPTTTTKRSNSGAVSGIEFKNGAIMILLGTVACMMLANGF